MTHTKGIVPAILEYAGDSEPLEIGIAGFSYEQFLKDTEGIFDFIGPSPRVMCTHCRDVVSPVDGDCSCGYIGRAFAPLRGDDA